MNIIGALIGTVVGTIIGVVIVITIPMSHNLGLTVSFVCGFSFAVIGFIKGGNI